MAETNSNSIEGASRNASSIQHLAQSLDKQVAQFRL
jgi:methyl-accepting chemotaxis protein